MLHIDWLNRALELRDSLTTLSQIEESHRYNLVAFHESLARNGVTLTQQENDTVRRVFNGAVDRERANIIQKLNDLGVAL